MSDIILQLPDHVVNQISAGEVVQRPSSVVKELLENSIDADASYIKLIIKEGGKYIIQVIDNGIGMSFNDAKVSFERHSTSKIRSIQDIFSIYTKGFRGEALSSIASVSQVELKTKRKCDELGTHILIEAGNILYHKFLDYQEGTSFLIKNLFFNIPVRKKFLKPNFIEFKYIIQEFIRIAIAHFNVNLKLYHNDKIIYNLKSSSLILRIVELFGKNIEKYLVPIKGETDNFSISGFITKPEFSKNNKNYQFFFVNNRFFKKNVFTKSILDAYEGVLNIKQYPIFFIFIKTNSSNIDINIHPTKIEVQFDHELNICKFLKNIVKNVLGIYNFSLNFNFNQDKKRDIFFKVLKKKSFDLDNNINDNNFFNACENLSNFCNTKNNDYKNFIIDDEFSSREQLLFTNNLFHLFRLQNGYWLLDELDRIYLLNMYRIHQTVLYYRLLEKKFNPTPQQLIFPIKYSISKEEYVIFESIKKNLFLFGFKIQLIENILYCYSIPCGFSYNKFYDFFDELIKSFSENDYCNFSEFYFKIFVKILAKKKKDFLKLHIVEEIIKEFKSIKMLKYNPFGKKNYIVVSFSELMNKF